MTKLIYIKNILLQKRIFFIYFRVFNEWKKNSNDKKIPKNKEKKKKKKQADLK